MIVVDELTKHYGETIAVDALSFTVQPGTVTGFLGPNGAGKSTTMRMILGLDRPTHGTATINGRPLNEHSAPLTEIGFLLDAGAVHARRSARNHLRALAATNGINDSRVDDVIEIVGLADDGRTVFVSSHLMTEMELIADHFVIVGAGRLIADVTAAELEAMAPEPTVRVRTPDAGQLCELLVSCGADVHDDGRGVLTVTGIDSEQIGIAAGMAGLILYELTPQHASLEQTFMDLTSDAVQYRAGAAEALQ